MYVCVCNAVTESQIHQAVREGATTVKHLKETLGVGTECTCCVGCAKACIKEATLENSRLEMNTSSAETSNQFASVLVSSI